MSGKTKVGCCTTSTKKRQTNNLYFQEPKGKARTFFPGTRNPLAKVNQCCFASLWDLLSNVTLKTNLSKLDHLFSEEKSNESFSVFKLI